MTQGWHTNLFNGSTLDPLGGEGAGSDRRSASERLELGVDDLPVVVDLDLSQNMEQLYKIIDDKNSFKQGGVQG